MVRRSKLKRFCVFPKGFLWGTSTSAYQVEGGIRNDWSESDPPAGEARDKFNAGKACDHYNRYEEDFDIAKNLNNNAYRFSIEWSRIEPEEGKWDEKEIEHYRKVIQALRARGIEPFVTLWHWTNPIWISKIGGWENKKTIDYFVRYVGKIIRSVENTNIKFWITLNEPKMFAFNSYFRGIWPPQKKSFCLYLKILKNLVEAHKLAFDAIKKNYSLAQIGIAKNNTYFEGWLAPVARWFWNEWFLNKIKKHQDFIGLNYYFHNRIKGLKFNQNENKERSDMKWEIYPEGIYHVLKDLKKYNKPIYITENGVADAKDIHREKFIKDHLKYVHQAIEEGVDVRGYFYWSLLDNFEWDKGFWPRFGLVEVDYKTMERKIRPSAKVYAEICKNNGFEIR